MKKKLLTSCALLLCIASAFSQIQSQNSSKETGVHSSFQNEKTPASVKQTEKGENNLYSFQSLTSPDKELLDQSLARFRQIEGFVSLSVNAQNVVELITTHSISQKDTSYLLMVSSRLYGYIGYNIIA